MFIWCKCGIKTIWITNGKEDSNLIFFFQMDIVYMLATKGLLNRQYCLYCLTRLSTKKLIYKFVNEKLVRIKETDQIGLDRLWNETGYRQPNPSPGRKILFFGFPSGLVQNKVVVLLHSLHAMTGLDGHPGGVQNLW